MVQTSVEPRAITFQPDIYDRLMPHLPPPGARVIDVGAGEGFLARRLADLGYSVTATDYSQEDFRCPDIAFTSCDLNVGIPLPDDQFDCAVSVEVIEHVENHFQFVREMVRVTRPGGLVIITTPNVVSFPSRFNFLLYGFTDCAPYPIDPTAPDVFLEHINPISIPEMLFCLERSGASVVAIGTNRLRKGAWLPMLLLYPVLWLAIRWKFLRPRHARLRALYERNIRWLLSPAALMGRIAIVVARKGGPA